MVCIKHFNEQFIIYEDKINRPDRSVLCIKRDRVKLPDIGIPKLFYNQPKYLTKEMPKTRKDPAQRQVEIRFKLNS